MKKNHKKCANIIKNQNWWLPYFKDIWEILPKAINSKFVLPKFKPMFKQECGKKKRTFLQFKNGLQMILNCCFLKSLNG